MECPKCNILLSDSLKLFSDKISPMKNGSIVYEPFCSKCGYVLKSYDLEKNISRTQNVIIISGPVGSGKSTIGNCLQTLHDFKFIDGDAITKKVNYYKVTNEKQQQYYLNHAETIETMVVMLGLGFNVVIGYIINENELNRYLYVLQKYGISPFFRVLIPKKEICIKRDIDRKCWTAGNEYIEKWYEEQRIYLETMESNCIDSSKENISETLKKHFEDIIDKCQPTIASI
jgi:adenylylsulfate kinase-like enzyme